MQRPSMLFGAVASAHARRLIAARTPASRRLFWGLLLLAGGIVAVVVVLVAAGPFLADDSFGGY